jgi:hypothetical protein
METVNRIRGFLGECDDPWPAHHTSLAERSSEIYNQDVDNQIGPQVQQLTPDQFQSLLKVLERVAQTVVNERRFKELAAQWKKETKFVSNITTKSVHLAYQKIIGMGEAAVPLILKDLKDNGPGDWFWALTMITDENPITEEIAGNMKAMTGAWLQWGTNIGYLKDSPQKTKNVLSFS